MPSSKSYANMMLSSIFWLSLHFVENLKNPKVKSMYGSNDPNEFPDKDAALKAVFHVNAGLGNDLSKPIFQETLAKSTAFRDDMLAKNMV